MADVSQLSSFTVNHDQHDLKWSFPGSRPHTLFCLACAVETFESPSSEVPTIRKKHLLGELLKALTSHGKFLLELLTEDSRVAWHLTQTVYSILEVSDEALSAVVIEVLVQLSCALKSHDLVCYLVHQISTQIQQACGFSASLPALTLLGQLLVSIPALGHTLNQNEDSLVTHILTGLAYPDEKVKSSCAFILAHAVTWPAEGGRQVCWCRELADSLLPLLASAQSKDLRINAMGLLRKLLESEDLTRPLMQHQGKASLASVLKKMLLSRDDILQVTSVQCTAQVLLHQKTHPSHCQYAEDLLNGDVAEFLYEALATTNGLLLSSTFCCLLLFTEIENFFTKCHTVYGIEPIVRAVQQSAKLNNTEALNHGLQLLSEILKKQPEDIHLLHNDSTLVQLCTLLTDCMTHTVTTTVIHATQTLANLLRRDHLPRPVRFQPLVKSLQALLDSLQRLPKPLVGSGGSGGLRRPHGSKRSQPGHTSQQDKLGRAQGRQEVLLSQGLEVMLRACRLAATCLRDPGSIESQFTAPDPRLVQGEGKTQGNGLDALIQFLLQAVDGVCIPLVMVNLESISLPDIFTNLFGMLSVTMEICSANRYKFSIKLASSSFIQLALTIRNRFPAQDRQLQDVINSFLSELCASLHDPCRMSEEQQGLKEMLQEALPQIQGSGSEMLHLLHELPAASARISSNLMDQDDRDKKLRLKQQACLALLYYAFLYNDRLAPEGAVYEAMNSFLSNFPNLKQLPRNTSKHLLLLLATCHGNRNEQSMHTGLTGVEAFLRHLEDGDMSDIYTHHHCILDWCFAPVGCQRSDLARRMMEQWMLHNSSCRHSLTEDECRESTMPTILTRNPVCFETILDIMSSGSEQLVQESLSLLESALSGDASRNEDTTQMMLEILKRRLPDITQRIFISEDQSPSEVHILALLRLINAVNKLHPKEGLDAADIKLLYHVANVISKTTSSDPHVLQACLNYLTCLLIQTAPREETRVVSVLLSSTSTLELLEDLLSSESPSELVPLQCSCLSMVSQIIICQSKFNIKVPHTMSVALSFAMDLMQKSKHILRKVCSIQLWTALFNTKFESPVLRLVNRSSPKTLLDDESVGLALPSRCIKTVYIWLQNSIVQGDHLLSQAAVACMRSMIGYLTDKSQSLANHLLVHPWNQHLVKHCLESSHDAGQIPIHVIQLITMFLQHGNRERLVTVEHLEDVVDHLTLMDASGCQDQMIISDALMLAQQVIMQPDVQLTAQIVHSFQTLLLQVTDNTKQSSQGQQDLIIRTTGGVILPHPRSSGDNKAKTRPLARAGDMKGFAEDLLQKLAKYQE